MENNHKQQRTVMRPLYGRTNVVMNSTLSVYANAELVANVVLNSTLSVYENAELVA